MDKGNELRISDGLVLPLDIVTDTVGILAIKGSGKTYTFLVLVEEMVKRNLPAVVIDTMGVCWGLRSSVDGKSPGLPIVILGGTHGDVPLESTAGKVIADWIVNERQPAVLDISEFTKGEASRFILDFLTRLFQMNRNAMHLFIDEADEWAPQRPFREEARTLRAMEVLVRRGRARGIGVTLVTQRPATLNKNVLTQVSTLIVGRMISPQDRKAVQAWIDAHGTEHQKEAFWESLASLSTKEKWVWAPARNMFRRVTIRLRETFDSSATPRVGEKVSAPKSLAEVDLETLKGRIAATIERAKQEDPRELRKQLTEMTKLYHQALGSSTVKVEIPIEVPVLTDHQLSELEKSIKAINVSASTFGGLSLVLQKISDEILKAIRGWPARVRESHPIEKKPYNPDFPERMSKVIDVEKKRDLETGVLGDIKLRLGERRMLEVLARRYPAKLTKAQFATLSGLTGSGGTFTAYYGVLKRAGLLEEILDGSGTVIYASKVGLDYCDTVARTPQTTEEVVEMWRRALRRGERKLLDVLIEIYPNAISRSILAEQTELTANAGTFSAYLGTLRRNGLAEVKGAMVRAGEALFLKD